MHTSNPANPVDSESSSAENSSNPGELDIFAAILLLRAHRVRIVVSALVALCLMAVYTFEVTPRFSATATVIIPQKNTSAAGLALQAAAGLDLVGGGNEIFEDILKSRTVAERLIAQFQLKQHYKTPTMELTEKILTSRTLTTSSKEGLLAISVQDEDPKMAAALANGYVTQLDAVNRQLAIGEAAQQRRYFEQEMIKEKDHLADAEVALKLSEEKTGVVEPTMQVQASISAVETTRAQLRARQVQLGALLQSETSQNPDVIRVRGEIASIEAQLQALQLQGGPEAGTPTAKNPERVLIYVRNLREVKFHEALFELLSREYATAKEQESKDISAVEILDPAIPADHKTWPPRRLYCLGALLFGALGAVAYTFLEKVVRTIILNPENKARYREVAAGATSGKTAL